MKKAIQFGAGNIGRGFIGLLLSLSGYEVTFIDIDDEIVNALNLKKSYQVIEVGTSEKRYNVNGVSAINAKNTAVVAEEISSADLITTAVGPKVLKDISPIIAKGLQIKIKKNQKKPLNIIACENAVNASSQLKKYVFEHLSAEERNRVEMLVGFPDSAVDRIIPPQDSDTKLSIKVEPFYEWIVNESQFKGNIPRIKGMKLTHNLKAYVERKIFTLNTGHAGTAYIGYKKGYRYIHDAIKDREILSTVKGALEESGESLIKLYGFSREVHNNYINKIIQRFKNPKLKDSVVRVGRDPLRKLGPEDRLVKPVIRAVKIGIFPKNLCKCIAYGLVFDPAEDLSAKKMQYLIRNKGLEKSLVEITGISPDEPVGKEIIKMYKQIEKKYRGSVKSI